MKYALVAAAAAAHAHFSALCMVVPRTLVRLLKCARVCTDILILHLTVTVSVITANKIYSNYTECLKRNLRLHLLYFSCLNKFDQIKL